MIGRLRGTIEEDLDGNLLVDVHGVGYEVVAPLGTLGKAAADADGLRTLLVYTHVREDAFILFAFANEADRHAFRQLISVSSVGPKTAIAILSALPGPELGTVVARKELTRLTQISGIGKKTAERILLELEDKIPTLPAGEAGSLAIKASQTTAKAKSSAHVGNAALVFNALVGMGYKQPEAERALAAFESERLYSESTPIAQLIREALASLTK
jgi:holliday junction DNA helicase RuvA